MKITKLVLGNLIVFFIFLEIAIRFSAIDLDYLKNTLFYSPVDLEVHQVSEDPELLYELKPSSKHESNYGFHALEKIQKYPRIVSINPLGYRFSPWKKEKERGVFRILILGGSNTYGTSVSDENTVSYKLFKRLDKWRPGRFEVWNGGLTASRLSQKLRLAERAIHDLHPDLIIIQHFINMGRRPFLKFENNLDSAMRVIKRQNFFGRNPDLYLENIPSFLPLDSRLHEWHNILVRYWAGYRLLKIISNNYEIKKRFPNLNGCDRLDASCGELEKIYGAEADRISLEKFEQFVQQNRNQKIIVFDPIYQIYCNGQKNYFHGAPVFSLCSQGYPSEYTDPHPPAYVYDYYAASMFKYLSEQNYF